jgi:hypothetical protein
MMIELSNFNEPPISIEHKTYRIIQSTKCMRERTNGKLKATKFIVNRGELYSGIIEFYKKNMFLNIGLHPKINRNIYVPIVYDTFTKYVINIVETTQNTMHRLPP